MKETDHMPPVSTHKKSIHSNIVCLENAIRLIMVSFFPKQALLVFNALISISVHQELIILLFPNKSFDTFSHISSTLLNILILFVNI